MLKSIVTGSPVVLPAMLVVYIGGWVGEGGLWMDWGNGRLVSSWVWSPLGVRVVWRVPVSCTAQQVGKPP